MTQPELSIIIPAYNSSAFICQTLDNILLQGVDNLEVLVINDGSTDNTAALVSSYAEKQPCIRLISKENGGVSSARNLGIEKAAGKYVCFQDADDLYETGSLKALIQTANETGSDVVICRLRTFDESGKGKFNAYCDELANESKIDCFDLRLLWNFLVSNKLYLRTRLVQSDVRFPGTKYSEEGAFFMSYAFTQPKITGCPGAVALYRRHTDSQGESVSQTVSIDGAKSFCASMDIIYSEAEKETQKLPNEQRNAYLGEIQYKRAYVLLDQFYRPMWRGDEECVSFCADEISRLLPLIPNERKAELMTANIDLRLEKLPNTKAAVAAKPNISVILKPSKRNITDFTKGMFAQLSPMFELFICENSAGFDELNESIKAQPNLHILPADNFLQTAKRQAKGKIMMFSRPAKLDKRMIRLVYKLKGMLPNFLVEKFFSPLAKLLNFALVKGIIK